jgi:hypothetical protein
MSGQPFADDAASALVEIDRRQDQVIEQSIIPWWYWWTLAALIIGLTGAVESERSLVIGIGVGGFVLGLLISTGWIVLRMVGNLQPRRDLIRPAGVLAILGLAAAVNAVTVPTGLLLEAAGVRYPATMATILGGVVLVVGGPVLMRFLRNNMRANRPGGQR